MRPAVKVKVDASKGRTTELEIRPFWSHIRLQFNGTFLPFAALKLPFPSNLGAFLLSCDI